MRFSKWDIAPLSCDHPLEKLFKTRNLQERESLSIFEWGSYNFGSGPKLSLLHLIFILCNLLCVEVLCDQLLILLFCNLFTVFNYWVCNWVCAVCFCTVLTPAEGFRRELMLQGAVLLRTASVLVQWVSALVSH